MILADTSVWVDHLRSRDGILTKLLEAEAALAHPIVIGERALGIDNRHRTIQVGIKSALML